MRKNPRQPSNTQDTAESYQKQYKTQGKNTVKCHRNSLVLLRLVCFKGNIQPYSVQKEKISVLINLGCGCFIKQFGYLIFLNRHEFSNGALPKNQILAQQTETQTEYLGNNLKEMTTSYLQAKATALSVLFHTNGLRIPHML